jgi:hypothetical protein
MSVEPPSERGAHLGIGLFSRELRDIVTNDLRHALAEAGLPELLAVSLSVASVGAFATLKDNAAAAAEPGPTEAAAAKGSGAPARMGQSFSAAWRAIPPRKRVVVAALGAAALALPLAAHRVMRRGDAKIAERESRIADAAAGTLPGPAAAAAAAAADDRRGPMRDKLKYMAPLAMAPLPHILISASSANRALLRPFVIGAIISTAMAVSQRLFFMADSSPGGIIG